MVIPKKSLDSDPMMAIWADGYQAKVAAVTVGMWKEISSKIKGKEVVVDDQDSQTTETYKEIPEETITQAVKSIQEKKSKIPSKAETLENGYIIRERKDRTCLVRLSHCSDSQKFICQVVVHDLSNRDMAFKLMKEVASQVADGADPYTARDKLIEEKEEFSIFKKVKKQKIATAVPMAASSSNPTTPTTSQQHYFDSGLAMWDMISPFEEACGL